MRDVFGDVEVDGVFGVFSVQGVDDGEDVIGGGHAARFAVDGTVEEEDFWAVSLGDGFADVSENQVRDD